MTPTSLQHVHNTATGESPATSYFGTEVISVVTTHGNDSRADRKVNVFERQHDLRSEVVIRSELTVSAHIVATGGELEPVTSAVSIGTSVPDVFADARAGPRSSPLGENM